jgi:hypothetical protein
MKMRTSQAHTEVFGDTKEAEGVEDRGSAAARKTVYGGASRRDTAQLFSAHSFRTDQRRKCMHQQRFVRGPGEQSTETSIAYVSECFLSCVLAREPQASNRLLSVLMPNKYRRGIQQGSVERAPAQQNITVEEGRVRCTIMRYIV